jgi:hypothetical protein
MLPRTGVLAWGFHYSYTFYYLQTWSGLVFVHLTSMDGLGDQWSTSHHDNRLYIPNVQLSHHGS